MTVASNTRLLFQGNSASVSGAGTFTINGGATVGGTSSSATVDFGGKTLTFPGTATLQVGDGSSPTTGTALTFTNANIAMNSGSTLGFNLYGGSGGNGVADLLVVGSGSSLTLNGVNLKLSYSGVLEEGVTYNLASYNSAFAAGAFTNVGLINPIPDYSGADYNGYLQDQSSVFGINYNSGGYVTATVLMSAIPEPSTWAMLLTGAMMGGLGYWRKRRRASAPA